MSFWFVMATICMCLSFVGFFLFLNNFTLLLIAACTTIFLVIAWNAGIEIENNKTPLEKLIEERCGYSRKNYSVCAQLVRMEDLMIKTDNSRDEK